MKNKYAALLLILSLLLPAAVLTVSAGDQDALSVLSSPPPAQETGDTSGGSASLSDPLGMPVSYGLRVLAAREELVFSGLCGNEVGFDAESLCRAMNLRAGGLEKVTLLTLPTPEKGTLFAGAVPAAAGQTFNAQSFSLLSFAPADEGTPCRTSFEISVNDGGCPVKVTVCTLPSLNYTPTVSLAPRLSLQAETYADIPVSGTLSAYDPEGDELTYEIVSYTTHGRLSLTDRRVGAYVYTPDAGYTGKDSFAYVVRDTCGNYSASATVCVQVSAYPDVPSYVDLDGEDCAAAAVTVSAAGLMNGTRVGHDDYFRPSAPVSRADFLLSVMQACGMTPEGSAAREDLPFADADAIPAAMRPWISMALNRGILTGKTRDGKLIFAHDEPISRAEAAVILSNVIGYAKDTTVSAFADADALPSWSVSALTSLRALGLLTTPDGQARPAETLTRGDAAGLLAKMLRLLGR